MGEESSGSGSWWGGWLQAAKDKSSEAIDFIRRDLEEFSSVVQSDTRNLVASTANTIRDRIALPEVDQQQPSSTTPTTPSRDVTSVDTISADAISVETNSDGPTLDATIDASTQECEVDESPLAMLGITADEVQEVKDMAAKTGAYMSKGFSSFLSTVSQALIILPDDDDEDPIVFKEDGMIFNRGEARLHCLRVDPATYCDEPEGPSYVYERWLDENDLEEHKSRIATLLVDCAEMRALYTQLVPAVISHAQFWSRYFFKVEQMESDERRREALKARADDVAKTRDDALGWGDDDDDIVVENAKGDAHHTPISLKEPPQTETPSHLSSATDDPILAVPSMTDIPAAAAAALTAPFASVTAVATAVTSAIATTITSEAATTLSNPIVPSTSPLLSSSNDVSVGPLSAGEVDSVLRMEDEMRSSPVCDVDGAITPPPLEIDPQLVDQVLRREEGKLSPKRKHPSPTPTPSSSKDEEDVVASAAAVVEEVAFEAIPDVTDMEASSLKEVGGDDVVEEKVEVAAEKATLLEENDAKAEATSLLCPLVPQKVPSSTDDSGILEDRVSSPDEGKIDVDEIIDENEGIKGLVVVDAIDEDSAVGSRTTPTPTPTPTPSSKEESAASGDDWEKELDIELTEEEIKMADKQMLTDDGEKIDDDWESWE